MIRFIITFVRDLLRARLMGANVERYGRVFIAAVQAPGSVAVELHRLGDGTIGRELPPVLVKL